MPGLIQEPPYKTIEVKELHPTFAAEVKGVNFQDVPEEQFSEILAAMAKYGVCVFRNTGLDDAAHVSFSRRFGELDNTRRYMTGGRKPRYGFYELFDAGNIDAADGSVLDPESPRAHSNRGNGLFHADSSFNPRRASFSLLRACALPPPGHGGNTEFADSRAALADLPPDLERRVRGCAGAHSMAHSRRLAAPAFFAGVDPSRAGFCRHPVAQRHEPSGRGNLYVGAHVHHVEDAGGREVPGSWELVQRLNAHAAQDKHVVGVAWENVGDMIIWDNRCVLHRAGGGTFEGKYKRDLRRTTVHDDSPTAWGCNAADSTWLAFNGELEAKGVAA